MTALGTGGSNRIRTAILQVAVNLLDHGMGLEDAVEAPRLHVERYGAVSFEPGLPAVPAESSRAGRARARPGPSGISSSAACMLRAVMPKAASKAPAIRAATAMPIV